jgi:lipopolysaccharide export system protein LptA
MRKRIGIGILFSYLKAHQILKIMKALKLVAVVVFFSIGLEAAAQTAVEEDISIDYQAESLTIDQLQNKLVLNEGVEIKAGNLKIVRADMASIDLENQVILVKDWKKFSLKGELEIKSLQPKALRYKVDDEKATLY